MPRQIDLVYWQRPRVDLFIRNLLLHRARRPHNKSEQECYRRKE